MSLSSHIVELKKKHQALSEEVEKLQRSPGVCNFKLKNLKKQKLQLKEEITRLEGGFAQPEADILDFPKSDDSSPPTNLKQEGFAAVGT